MKRIFSYTLLLSAFVGVFAQDSLFTNQDLSTPKISYLDSLKSTFINHNTSNCIDERWMNELMNTEFSETMLNDVEQMNIDEEVNYNLPTELLKKRIIELDQKSPFNIEYHPALENTIKAFLKNRKSSFERLMSISAYYFPMFEERLAKYNVPLEIKYLAIVESALNPKAKSRVGATGLWQFMYPTGKQYNLEVNSYVDERYDPLKATEAACQYLSQLYEIFGDWNMVLASYNAGPGNVSKAIRRSGGSQNYWNIRQYLPRETANYVPAFLATMYVYEYKDVHRIKPKNAVMSYFETDTVMIKKEMSFKNISDLLDVSEEQIEFLNPIYKLKSIPFIEGKPHYLRLTKNKIGVFVSNEEKVYDYLDYLDKQKEKAKYAVPVEMIDTDSTMVVTEYVMQNKTIYHTVKRGENLSSIADKHNVTLSQLKKWNKLKANSIQSGKKLRIETSVKVAKKVLVPRNTNEAIVSTEQREEEINEAVNNEALNVVEEPRKENNLITTTKSKIEKQQRAKYYTVRKGDTLYSIAKRFPGVSAKDIKKWNNISGDNIKVGTKLKING